MILNSWPLSGLAARYLTVVCEDLGVPGMTRNQRLACAIAWPHAAVDHALTRAHAWPRAAADYGLTRALAWPHAVAGHELTYAH
jgi:hypothetical protein